MPNQSFDINWDETQLVPQMTNLSCWAASAAMLVGWRDRVCIDPSTIAAGTGVWSAYQHGLNPADVPTLAQAWTLQMESPQCYTIDGLRNLLEQQGPLWVAAAVPSLHAVVVTGMYSEGEAESTFVRIHDPWPPGQGSRYDRSLWDFVAEYEAASDFPSVNIQILHTGGRPF